MTGLSYRAKATNAFKAGYAITWLTLGPAAILYAQPDREELEKKLRGRMVQSAEVREAQIRALRGTTYPVTTPESVKKKDC